MITKNIDLAKNPSKNAHEFIIKHFEDIVKAFSDKRISNLFKTNSDNEGTKISELAPFKNSTKAALKSIKDSGDKTTISVSINLGAKDNADAKAYTSDSYIKLVDEIIKILNTNKTKCINRKNSIYKAKGIAFDQAVFTVGYHICSDKTIVLIIARLGAYDVSYDATLKLTYKILEDTENNKKLIGIHEATIFDECVFIGI